jgi:cytochrome c biogenesis protein CcmG, thiol:disulfide interchange protein DsbE
MVMTRGLQIALGLVATVVVLGVALTQPASLARAPLPPAPRSVAALVNGQPVPLALYRREVGVYRVTLPSPRPARGSPEWQAREAVVEDRALRQAVAETIIAREAARRGLAATPAAVRAELEHMRTEAGGAAALAAIAHQEGLSQDDLRAKARTAVLDDLLVRHSSDSHLVDHLYARAHVIYYVGPHAGLRGLAPAPRVGHPAPDVAATTLAGQATSLSDLRGATVVLNIWATTCTWCRIEMPLLDRFARTHPRVRVVALDQGEDHATVAAYVRALGLHLPIWLDQSSAAAKTYGLTGLPDTFVIDRDGIVRAVTIGALGGETALRRMVAEATR